MKTFRNLITFAFLLTCLTPTFASDSLTIEGYLSARQIKAEKMAEGIFCTIYTEGVGKVPKQGEYVKIRYVGKLLNGNVFDKSPEEEPYIFKLGNGQVIDGWNKAIEKLKIGTKTTLYIPSHLAYGVLGVGNVIPPNAPLAYDIELLEVLNQAQYDAIMHRLEDKRRKIFDNRVVLQFENIRLFFRRFVKYFALFILQSVDYYVIFGLTQHFQQFNIVSQWRVWRNDVTDTEDTISQI